MPHEVSTREGDFLEHIHIAKGEIVIHDYDIPSFHNMSFKTNQELLKDKIFPSINKKKRDRNEVFRMSISMSTMEQLQRDTGIQITMGSEEWLAFLKSASHIYKYPFKEQLLIYAKRPDASACASI